MQQNSMPRTVIVTGASRGIGKAIATEFAVNGDNVVINYCKHEAEALSLATELSRYARVLALKADVSDAKEVSALVDKTLAVFGKIDVLINNAGVAKIQLLSDATEEDWDRLTDINLKGVYLMTKACIPNMISNQSGKIINISSMWGIKGASCEAIYSASKAGVIGFTKAMARELGLSNITVNCIAPGLIDTDINAGLDKAALDSVIDETPLNRIGKPQDIANAAYFLASDKADFITAQVLQVDGGLI